MYFGSPQRIRVPHAFGFPTTYLNILCIFGLMYSGNILIYVGCILIRYLYSSKGAVSVSELVFSQASLRLLLRKHDTKNMIAARGTNHWTLKSGTIQHTRDR